MDSSSPTTFVQRFLELIHAGGEILSAIAFISGIAFAMYFLFLLFQSGKQQGFGSIQNMPAALIFSFLAAAFLIRFGYSIFLLQETFYGDGNFPEENVPTMWKVSDSFNNASLASLQATFVRDLFALVGAVAIFRALMMLPRFGNHTFGAQPPSAGKFFAFLIAGALMIRAPDFAKGIGYFVPVFTDIGNFLANAV